MNKSLSISALATTFAVLLGASQANATTYYFDTNSGTWNTAANWSTTSTTGGTGAVPTASDTAVFNQSSKNAATTANLGGAFSVGGVTFANTGTTLLTGGGTASALTIGATGLTENIGAGAVTIGGAGATNAVNINLSGTQSWTNNSSVGALTVTNNVSNSTTTPAVLTLAGSGTSGITINGNITDNGAGTIAVTNSAGTNTLAGTNTYSGTTTVNGGTLKVQGSGALSANSAVSLGSGTILVQNNGTTNNGTISLGNNITLPALATTDVISVANNGSNTGNTVAFGALSMGGSGIAAADVVNFTGANGYLESFTSLSLAGSNGQSTTLNPTTTSVTITGNVTNPMTITTAGSYDTLVIASTSTGNVTINGIISDASTASGSGQGFGNTNINMSGSGTLTLAGANTYHGITTTSKGTINLAGTGASLANTAISTTGSGLFNEASNGSITGTSSVASGSTATSVLAGSNSYTGATTVTAGSTLSLTGSLTGNTAITTAGTGVFNESSAGSISGTTASVSTAGTGTSVLAGSNSYTGATTVTAGSTLSLTGSLTGNTAITTAGTGVFNESSAGSISGTTASVSTAGTGTSVLAGTNTYGGVTTVGAGSVLNLVNEVSLYNNVTSNWTATNIVVASTGTLDLSVGGAGQFTNTDVSTLSGLGTSTGGFKSGAILGLDTTGGNFTLSNLANPNSGANILGLAKYGTNTLTLATANTYTGGTTINAGTVVIGNAKALGTTSSALSFGAGSTGALSLNGNSITLTDLTTSATTPVIQDNNATAATLTINTANTDTYAGVLQDGTSGTLALVLGGAGTETLGGANTFSGGTTVNAGTLSLTGSMLNTGTLTVGVTGTFNYAAVGTNTQSFAKTVISGGTPTINTTVSTDTLNLGTLARTAPGIINFGATGTGTITTTTVNTASTGIIAPWAVFGTGTNTSYAAAGTSGTATAISAYTSGTAISTVLAGATTPTTNYTINATGTMTGAISGNTLQVQNTDVTAITLANGGKNLTLNGILNTAGTGGGLTISGTGNIVIGSNNELDLISTGSTNLVISAPIVNGSGASSVVLDNAGTGSISLTGANTYSGGTYINAGAVFEGGLGTGTVTLGVAGSSANAYLVNSGSTVASPIAVNPGSGVRGIYTSGGSTPIQSGLITLLSGATLQIGNNGSSVLGVTGGVTGTGTLLIDYPSGNSGADRSPTAPVAISGGAISLSGTVVYGAGILGVTGGSAVTTISSAITDGTGGADSVVVNTTLPGALILSGANTYTGGTTVTSGAIDFQVPGAIPSTGAITAANAGTVGLPVGTTTGLYTSANIDTLWSTGTLGNITLSSGSGIGLDTTAGSFTYGTAQSTRSLAKFGTNTLTLTGANTYAGATTLYAGTLAEGAANAFSPNSAYTIIGGTLDISGGGANTSIASLNNNLGGSGFVTLGGNKLSITSNAPGGFGGVISGTGGSLAITGGGTFSLTNSNTYTGGTTVSGGTTLALNSTGNLASSVTVDSGSFISIARPASESGTIGASSIISGAGAVVQNINNPNQAFTLDRPNTYTGPTQGGIRGGFIAGVATVYDGNGNPVSGAFGVNSQIQFTSGSAVLALNGYANQVGSISATAGNGYIVLGGLGAGRPASVLTTGGDNLTATYGSVIADTSNQNSSFGTGGTMGGSIVKIGTGDQTFSGSNLYAGSTTIKGGILTVTTLSNGGVATTASAADAGTATLNVSSTAGLVVGQSLEATGVAIGTPPTITAIGANSVTLSALQTIANSTPLYFGNGNGLGISTNAASNLVLDGGTLQYTGTTTSTDRLFTVGSTVAGATGTLDASGAGAVTFSNTGSVAYGTTNQTRTLGLTGTNTGANTLATQIGDNGSGAVSVLKSGAGSWTLTNANTYSGGTTVNGGTLTSAVTGGFGAGNVTVAPTGTLVANSATLNSTGSISSTALVTVNNNGAAIGTVNFNGATPTIGGLSGNGNAVLNNATGTVLTVGANNSSSAFNGVISEGTTGMGSLTKAGTGTLRLNGANTYTGSTTVNAGTLIVGGSTAAGSAVTINNGGTLGGTGSTNEGTLNGTVTVASGTTGSINLQDGAIGTLSVGGLTVNGGKLSFDLGGGLTSDSIASAGALTINGATTINLGYVSGTPSLSNGTYSLITYNNGGGALGSTAFGNLTLNTSALAGTSNQTFTLVNNAGNLELNVASSTTGTTYTLTTTAGSTLLHAGATTGLTTTITNTGTGTADALNYTGLTASSSSGNGIAPGAQSGGPLANNGGTASNAQTYTATNLGTDTISANGSGTNATLTTGATQTSATGTSITVYSGFGTWITNGSGTWGTAPTAVPVNWSAAGGTPGVTAGFTGVDTATFGAQTATAITVGLNGAAPNLNAITFSSPDTAYTLAQNYAGGTGTSSITLSGTTPSINVTNPGSSLTAGTQTISAPLILGATTSLNVAANQKLNISGQISSAGTFGLTNSGPGTTTLTSDTGNTYTGPTTITGGTVFIKNTSGSATGTGAVTVSGSSTVLKGHGEIDGAVTLSGGATLFSGSTSAGTGPGTGMKLTSALAVNGAALTFQLSNGTNSATYANPNTTTSYLDLGTTGTVSFSGMDTINLVDLSNGGLTLRLQSPYLLISGSSSSVFYGLVIRTSSGAVGLSQNGFQGSVLGVWTGTGDDYKEFTFNQYGSDGITPLAPTDAGNTTGAYISPFLYLSGGNLEVVPEPGTWALMIGGLALLIVIQRRKHRSN